MPPYGAAVEEATAAEWELCWASLPVNCSTHRPVPRIREDHGKKPTPPSVSYFLPSLPYSS